jgi:hypothetical protein
MTGPRFSMVLPAQWQVLDFDPATRAWSVDRLVRRALGTAERLEPLRRDAARTYRRMLDDAAERGAFFAATVAMDLEAQPVAASVMAFLLPAPAGPDGSPTTDPDALLLPLTEPAEGETLLEVGLMDLPVGRSVRLRARVAAGVQSQDGTEPSVDVVRYFTPRPVSGHLVVSAFSTPTLHVADALGELFDVMARSMAITDGEDAP